MQRIKEDFDALALAVVAEIPSGYVASYGQIADLMGYPKNARHVGKACGCSAYYGDYPCHRVVNGQGRLVPGWQQQRSLLEEEGVEFLPNGHVNMKKYQWK